MLSYRHIALAELAADDLQFFPRRWVFDPQQIFGQQLAKPAVDFADSVCADGVAFECPAINPFLDGNMRLRL